MPFNDSGPISPIYSGVIKPKSTVPQNTGQQGVFSTTTPYGGSQSKAPAAYTSTAQNPLGQSFAGGTSPTNSVYNTPSMATQPYAGIIPPQHVQPTQHPASVTTTDPNGGTVKTTYAGGLAPDDPSNKYNTATGQLNPNYDPSTAGTGNNPATPAATRTQSEIDAANTANNIPASGTGGSTFNQATQGLLNQANGQNPAVQSATQNIQNLENNENQSIKNLASEPMTAGDFTGQAGTVDTVYQNQIGNAQQALTNALQGQGQQITAGNEAAGLTQPQLGQQGQTYYNPLNPGATGSGSVQLTGVTSTDVSNLSQAVANGTIDYNSALSQLSGYGTAVQNQLLPAIQKLNPSFSVNASNASATTTAQGQAIQTQATSANQALQTLQNLYSTLPGASSTGIPGINSISNSIESVLGSSQLSSYKTALSDARAQLEGVLTATGATTPTGAADMAMTYLPDNMTPSQLQANIATVQQLIQQKVSSFTSSGNQSGSSGSGTMFGNFNG